MRSMYVEKRCTGCALLFKSKPLPCIQCDGGGVLVTQLIGLLGWLILLVNFVKAYYKL